jgi:excisionase family DNA binding protein
VPKSTGDDWFGTPEAARFLGVGLRTVYSFIDRGELPAYQLGRVMRVRRVDLLTFLETHRVQPGSIGHLYDQGKDTRAPEDEDG